MYLSCVKNYLNSLRYTFTVLGVVTLGLIIGIGTFGEMTGRAVTAMTQAIQKDYQAADLSLGCITDAVIDRAENLTAWDILNVIHDRSIGPLLIGEIGNSVGKVVDNYADFADQINEDIRVCVETIVTALGIGILAIVLSLAAGFFGVEICVRRRLSHVSFSRLFLEMLVRFLMYLLAAFIIFGLCTAFQEISGVLLCLLPFLLVFFGLIAAWLTADPKNVSFTEVVTFRNFCWLLLSNLTMLLATVLIGFFAYRLFNIAAAALIGVSLLTVLLVALDLSASTAAVKLEAAGKTKAVKEAPAVPEAGGVKADLSVLQPTETAMPVSGTPGIAETPAPFPGTLRTRASAETAPEKEIPAAPAYKLPVEERSLPETGSSMEKTDAEELQNQLKKRLKGKLQQ